MWAYSLVAPKKFESIETETLVEEHLKPGEVLLKFKAGSICGSDLPFAKHGSGLKLGEQAPPGWPLHEVVGEVVATTTSACEVGQRVVGWAKGKIALAEYVRANASQVAVVDLDLDDAYSTMVQPLACVLYALSRIDNIEGSRVAVIGQGPIGLLFAHALKHKGAAEVIGVDLVDRSEVAKTFGVDQPICASSREWALTLDPTERPSIVIEAVGHQSQTLNDAIEAIGKYGQLFVFGIIDEPLYALQMKMILDKEITLRCGRTHEHRDYLEAAVDYLRHYPELASNYVTHVLPVNDVENAFKLACSPATGQIKIALVL